MFVRKENTFDQSIQSIQSYSINTEKIQFVYLKDNITKIVVKECEKSCAFKVESLFAFFEAEGSAKVSLTSFGK